MAPWPAGPSRAPVGRRCRRPAAGDARTDALAAAYEQCRAVMAEHGRTFYLATRLLPRERRRHVWALYAFARGADELVDDPAGPRPAALDQLAARCALALSGPAEDVDPVAEPVLAAVAHTMAAYALPASLVAEFLASMAMDLTVTRYQTWADLRLYMRGSAAVIGELMAPVLGGAGPAARRYAGLLGDAFQLTNFVRDVAEDWQRGRLYLPVEDLRRCGVTEAGLGAAVEQRRSPTEVRELVRFQTERALGLYAAARPGLPLLDARGRVCVSVAFTLYRMILREVVDADYEVMAERHTVPTSTRVAVLTRLLLASSLRTPKRAAKARSGRPGPLGGTCPDA